MKEYQNETWIHGQPISRKALIVGGIAGVLGLTEAIIQAKQFWISTTPLPPCLDETGKQLSFTQVPCRLPVGITSGIPSSDPIRANEELNRKEQP